MLAVEAIIDENGNVKILEPLSISHRHRALVVILEELAPEISETALLSQDALAQDWLRPEEDQAWSYLHPATS